MKYYCEHDPTDLISLIGDPYFSIEIEENLTEKQKLSESVFIVDCERAVTIEISSEYGKQGNLISAEALVVLLNQEYEFIPCA
jgi:hypothetical protein